jgi:hypothetical protein
MKAWRFHRFNDMRLDDVPEPVCSPGQVSWNRSVSSPVSRKHNWPRESRR